MRYHYQRDQSLHSSVHRDQMWDCWDRGKVVLTYRTDDPKQSQALLKYEYELLGSHWKVLGCFLLMVHLGWRADEPRRDACRAAFPMDAPLRQVQSYIERGENGLWEVFGSVSCLPWSGTSECPNSHVYTECGSDYPYDSEGPQGFAASIPFRQSVIAGPRGTPY
jgi:hypothetical protein